MARTKQVQALSTAFIDELIQRHLSLSEHVAELSAQQAKIDRQLRVALEVIPDKTVVSESGSAMLVDSDCVSYDLETIQGLLSLEQLALVTLLQVDKERLEAAALLHAIPPEVLDRARRVIKRKPQLRVKGI